MNNKAKIIPPGVRRTFFEFLSQLEANEREPILIIGSSGVGKSFFLQAAEHYFTHKNVRKVKTVNCSHFAGDLNMVRSELFGHEKGSFTGASRKKKGFIEDAAGGVLILEEVGDLPKDAQAQLLTFIEDGKYYTVGGTDPKTVDVRIIAATNRPECLRDDFRYRFSEIEVPPLYKRRIDALFYFEQIDQDLFRSLRSWEVLAILAYNWPGNVREMQRLIAKIKGREVLDSKYDPIEGRDLSHREIIVNMWGGSSLISTEGDLANQLFLFLRAFPIPLPGTEAEVKAYNLLDDLLSKYMISIKGFNDNMPFRNVSLIDRASQYNAAGFVVCTSPLLPLLREGLMVFCSVLGKNVQSEKSLLDLRYGEDFLQFFKVPDPLLAKNKKTGISSISADSRYKDIFKYALKWTTGLETEVDVFRNGIDVKFVEWFKQLESACPDQALPGMSADKDRIFQEQIIHYTKEQLLNLYYSELLNANKLNQTAAAKQAGLKLSTFRSQAKRYGVHLNKH